MTDQIFHGDHTAGTFLRCPLHQQNQTIMGWALVQQTIFGPLRMVGRFWGSTAMPIWRAQIGLLSHCQR